MNGKELIKEYPFLSLGDIDGEIVTWLELLPNGWSDIVIEMCGELKKVLIANNILDEYEVIQAKEKFGALRWYDSHPWLTYDVIDKYEDKSERICVGCGNKATHMTKGYILPMCDKCDRTRRSNE